MNLNSVLSSLGSLSGSIATAIVPGAGPLISAGKAVLDAYQNVKSLNGGEAPADAEAQHDLLFKKVMDHADSTLGGLEGK